MACDRREKGSRGGGRVVFRTWSSMDQNVSEIRGSFEGEHGAFKLKVGRSENVPSFGKNVPNFIRLGIESSNASEDIPSAACWRFKKSIPVCIKSSFLSSLHCTRRVAFSSKFLRQGLCLLVVVM